MPLFNKIQFSLCLCQHFISFRNVFIIRLDIFFVQVDILRGFVGGPLTFTAINALNVTFPQSRTFNCSSAQENKNKWMHFRHVSPGLPRVNVETWLSLPPVGHRKRYHRREKMFLSDHFHVYSVLTFCLASGMKKMMRHVCTVFIYRCWSLCKLFSCWFFVALPFFPCAADESRQSSQNGLKIVKTTSECAIKQMRRFLRHRNGNSRCWDFWSFPEDNRRPRHKQTPSSDLFTAFRRQFITSLRLLICDYSWIFHVFALKFQLELSIRREAPWIINLNLFKFSFPFRSRKFASQDLLFLSWWHRLCVEKILLTLFRREVRVGVSNDH